MRTFTTGNELLPPAAAGPSPRPLAATLFTSILSLRPGRS